MTRPTLFKKFLVITLLLSLVPLIASSLILFFNLESISTRLAAEIAESADTQASESLQMRAQQVAESVADFLKQCESDLNFLAKTSNRPQTLLDFYQSRRGEVWERGGTATAPREVHESVPIYKFIAVLDSAGKELVSIRDGQFVPPAGRTDYSIPRPEFGNEPIAEKIRSLKTGRIYVSHLMGYHVSRPEQLAGAEDPEHAYGGRRYQGVILFGTPLTAPDGRCTGMILAALDHRHLIEFTQHIDPGPNFSTVFPSYKSGNYAFMFDDEGWIITHPKLWDLRGFDRTGKLVPAYSAQSSRSDRELGRIPFNLDRAGFIHPNYPVVADQVRRQQSGHVDITNVGGAKKIMAYAPIHFDSGDYGRHGIFGAVTIGFQVDQFHEAARKGSRLINRLLGEHRTQSAVILLATALLAACSAWGLSRGITQPLLQLTQGAHQLARGDSGSRVIINSKDEIGELATTFNYMADELELRKTSLFSTLDELRRSRLDILNERNFKESILESISSAILTFSPDGLLTSINATGLRFLGSQVANGQHYRQIFAAWNSMDTRIEQRLRLKGPYGREPLSIDQDGGMRYFEVGFFPIGTDAAMGLTVTMRDETEREKLRDEMMRLDRLASLGKLSAGIAHEVRNPLTGITLLLDDLHDRPDSAPEDRNLIKKAVEEIDRVERLINALLNYSSPVRAEFRQCDLSQVISDTALLMRRPAEKSGIRIETACADGLVFTFDPEKIKQALLNIVRNALEAMPSGGLIRIKTYRAANDAVIVIADTGPGISEDDLPLIFEPFFTRKGAGTGLGLSITQRIIDEHHGRIHVESSLDTGTSFTIVLPVA